MNPSTHSERLVRALQPLMMQVRDELSRAGMGRTTLPEEHRLPPNQQWCKLDILEIDLAGLVVAYDEAQRPPDEAAVSEMMGKLLEVVWKTQRLPPEVKGLLSSDLLLAALVEVVETLGQERQDTLQLLGYSDYADVRTAARVGQRALFDSQQRASRAEAHALAASRESERAWGRARELEAQLARANKDTAAVGFNLEEATRLRQQAQDEARRAVEEVDALRVENERLRTKVANAEFVSHDLTEERRAVLAHATAAGLSFPVGYGVLSITKALCERASSAEAAQVRAEREAHALGWNLQEIRLGAERAQETLGRAREAINKALALLQMPASSTTSLPPEERIIAAAEVVGAEVQQARRKLAHVSLQAAAFQQLPEVSRAEALAALAHANGLGCHDADGKPERLYRLVQETHTALVVSGAPTVTVGRNYTLPEMAAQLGAMYVSEHAQVRILREQVDEFSSSIERGQMKLLEEQVAMLSAKVKEQRGLIMETAWILGTAVHLSDWRFIRAAEDWMGMSLSACQPPRTILALRRVWALRTSLPEDVAAEVVAALEAVGHAHKNASGWQLNMVRG